MNDKDKVYLAHFLFPDDDMDEDVEMLLQQAAAAERMCRLKYVEGECMQDVCLLVHKDKTLIFYKNNPGFSCIELEEPGEVRRACARLFNSFEAQIQQSVGSVNPALLMSKQRYEELKNRTGTNPLYLLSQDLVYATGDYIQAPRLAKVMKNRSAEAELRLCARSGGDWVFQSASFITDHSSGFLLRMSWEAAEDWMIATPMSTMQFCSAFTEWVLNATPVT